MLCPLLLIIFYIILCTLSIYLYTGAEGIYKCQAEIPAFETLSGGYLHPFPVKIGESCSLVVAQVLRFVSIPCITGNGGKYHRSW